MKKLIILIITIVSLFVFSISKNEIINISKENPELAWEKFLEYVLENPTDTSIESLGKKIKLKIELKNKNELSFFIREDINGLRNYVKETNPSTYVLNLIDIFFPQIYKMLKNTIEHPAYETFLEDIIFLKIITPRIDVKKAAISLTNFFLKYPTMLTFNVITLFKEKPFSKELGFNILNYIVQNINEFSEKQYPILKRIVDFSKKIGGTYTSKYIQDLEKYVQILNNLENSNVENINLLKSEINNLTIKKNRLISLAEKYSPKATTPLLTPQKDKENQVKHSNNILIILLFILLILIFSFRIIRFYIFYSFGLKTLAAKTYKKIVEKDPMNEEKHLKLAQLYEEAGMYYEALEEYNLIKRLKI
ncbi:hypothetical protein SU69_00405 [Thermosipho melanesiensis]|uniref:Tetratricopeptide repeat protein n=2 Tax=Thermosipho melanesiensis TaxID=46541 RepID=A6LJ51_THEM4|nr:hypothetical protein [Thermosipho melanesiensis]ABR29952.1 hypothetical protein Tmel_0075 [Thermosipho melanesiensis BI429]APT73158.1 hypothetical protein BW47_00425 [Thermosipho melanesiensis]OOC38554.1 hypothetical protein SU68_00405 [Thermosipho melanesiensis]OOC40358.1 hypothetical protein SU70_00405 [Thermosipho melanesiensis]OOC40622.1 hypothetical protein SU69_00405 [Thermosipho melanesiensis]